MTLTCVLSKTTTDLHKSKLLSSQVSQLVLDAYITPQQFAELISDLDETEFVVEIRKR